MQRFILWLKKIWVDSVWSKVIAVAIVAMAGSVYGTAVSLWNDISFYSAWKFFMGTTVTLNLWLICVIIIVFVFTVLYFGRLWPFSSKLSNSKLSNRAEKNIDAKTVTYADDPLKMLKISMADSAPPNSNELNYLDEDPHEFRFYSIEKVRKMEGTNLTKNLNRFLCGMWELRARKNADTQIYDVQISVISDEILLRRRIGVKADIEVEMRQISFEEKSLTLKYVIYKPTSKEVIVRDSIRIHNNEDMSGMSNTGYAITYKRKGLFKAVH